MKFFSGECLGLDDLESSIRDWILAMRAGAEELRVQRDRVQHTCEHLSVLEFHMCHVIEENCLTRLRMCTRCRFEEVGTIRQEADGWLPFDGIGLLSNLDGRVVAPAPSGVSPDRLRLLPISFEGKSPLLQWMASDGACDLALLSLVASDKVDFLTGRPAKACSTPPVLLRS